MLFAAEYGNIIKPIAAQTKYGRLAQLVEHLLDVQEVTGSSPVPSTKRKPLTKVRGFFVASATVSRQSRTVQDSKSNDDDRGQRPKQGGVVGAAFGFFKAPPRGCGKIRKRNP